MFRNYFKTTFRSLWRNKGYSFLNIFGLAIGIACLLIFLVIQFETSFDDFHQKKKHIYRVATEFHNQDGVSYSDGIAFPVGNGIRIDFPQVREVASIYRNGGQITIENSGAQSKKFLEDHFYYAEPEFFSIFNFGWLAGRLKPH
jgi:hypothetical protein